MFFKKKLSGPVLMSLMPVVVETPLNCVVKMIKCAPWGKFKEALAFCRKMWMVFNMPVVNGEVWHGAS